ncbi:MAG: hypothetical protein K6E38_05705 [Fretibacterium sp.]|nr:hypothetical protein [Fretibacterium sp.]
MFLRKRWEALAGLAVHTDSLRYAELARKAGKLFEIRRETVSLPSGCLVRESIIRFDLLERAFHILRNKLGRFSCPVVLGIPARDTMLKCFDYPLMSLEEAREALNLEYKEHFPWPRDEAILDSAILDVPLSDSGMAVLAAAADRACADNLLWTARRAGISVAALEPVKAAFFRAVTGGHSPKDLCLALDLEPEVHSLILGNHGNGILFRTLLNNLKAENGPAPETALQAFGEDIRATLTFAGNRFQGMTAHCLILGGLLSTGEPLRGGMEEQTSMKVSLANVNGNWQIQGPNCAPGFEAAVGLALRGQFQEPPGVCIDLRPSEYVEQERRRHRFSAVRLTSVLLSLLFVLSCAGYAVLALRELYSLPAKIWQRQQEIAELETRQAALTEEVSRLGAREERITVMLKNMGRELPVLEVMDALERLCGPEICFTLVRFAPFTAEDEKEVCAVTVEGETSVLLSDLTGKLREEPLFESVEMLNYALNEKESFTFSLLLTTGLQTLANHEGRDDGK